MWDCGQSQWLVVLCKTLSFSFPSRFIPALSLTPIRFEKAANLRDVWQNLGKTLAPTRQFSRGRGLPSTVKPLEDLAELGEELRLAGPPRVMECFDISNVSSNHIVASMVRFTDGRPDNRNYRRYRIKTVQGQDDFASMAEVIRRRYSRILLENRAASPATAARKSSCPTSSSSMAARASSAWLLEN